MLRGKEKRYLRSLAHHLDPVVMVGKQGLSQGLIQKVEEALESHELIKVKFVEFKKDKKMMTDEIAAKTDSEVAGMIGHNAILYKQHPEEEKRKITLPKSDGGIQ